MAKPNTMSIALIWLLVGASFWLCAMSLVWQKMDGLTSAGFALLAHIPIAGYLVSLVLFVTGLALTISAFLDYSAPAGPRPDTSELIFGVLERLASLSFTCCTHKT